jgi:hypothetical protein
MSSGNWTSRQSAKRGLGAAVAAVVLLALVAGGAGVAAGQDKPITAPQPTVPEVFTLMGAFVRVAYNNEGFVTLGYEMANSEQGKEWVLLDMGITLRKGVADYTLTRDHLSLKTPDGKVIPLATNQEYKGANLQALNRRAKVMRDSINYFPLDADQPCAISFFKDTDSPGMAWDQVELSWQRACVGRLYFHVPGGIQIGQHWLVVKLAGSEVQVPFRIVTKEDEKLLRKKWQDLKKQQEASYKQ